MLDYKEDHKDLNYRFIKEVASTTKVKAWHVKVDGENYQILCTPLPRLYEVVYAYKATRTGKLINSDKPLLCIDTSDINEGAEELIAVLNGSPTREFHKLPHDIF